VGNCPTLDSPAADIQSAAFGRTGPVPAAPNARYYLGTLSEQQDGSGWEVAYEEGRRAWPTIHLSFSDFAAHAAKVAGSTPQAGLHASDLFLACACACGADRDAALALLEERYLLSARGSLLRLDSRSELIDDVMQELRTKLLVGEDPRIGHYGGRGPLLAWIRVSATRTAIDLLRATKQNLPLEAISAEMLPIADLGPEVQMLREAYRDAFKEALAATLLALSPKDRNLLRRHLIDHLTLDEIAVPYGVHPATIARRLSGLREEIAESVRQRLAAEHREAGGATSLESLAYAIRSEIHLSLGALLASGGMSPGDASDVIKPDRG
jgi:RNA polymerase sigma-70 factor (ECF subfamily)